MTEQGAGIRASLARPSRTLPLVVAVLALTVGVVVAGARDEGPGPGEAIVVVDGAAVVERADGGTDRVTGRTRLGPGDRFAMERGTAELELSDDVRYEAVGPEGDHAGTELRMARVPELEGGPLLVLAPEGATVRVGEGEARLAADSAGRLTQTLAARVDVFEGRATLASAGVEQEVAALRAAEIVAAGEVGRPRPVDYAGSDGWDRRYLGAALALDRQLGPLVSGLRTTRVAPADLAARLRGVLADVPSAARQRSLLAARAGGLDAAVGLAVVGSGDRGDFEARWERALRFHDAGAPWGLVAMDVGADGDDVVDALVAAIDAPSGSRPGGGGEERAGVDLGTDLAGEADGDPATADDPTAPDAVGGDGGGGTEVLGEDEEPPAGGTPSPTTPGVTTPPAVPGPTSPLPTVVPPVTVPVVTTIVEVVDGATGGVVTDLTETVGGVLAPVTGPVTGDGGLLGPVTGGGGLLGGVTGTGGLLPLGP